MGKDYNVLEAIDLCMNGNPVKDNSDSFVYEMKCKLEAWLKFAKKPWYPFKTGIHECIPIEENQ